MFNLDENKTFNLDENKTFNLDETQTSVTEPGTALPSTNAYRFVTGGKVLPDSMTLDEETALNLKLYRESCAALKDSPRSK